MRKYRRSSAGRSCTDEHTPGTTRITTEEISCEMVVENVVANEYAPSASFPSTRPTMVWSADEYTYQATRDARMRQPWSSGLASCIMLRGQRTVYGCQAINSAVVTP